MKIPVPVLYERKTLKNYEVPQNFDDDRFRYHTLYEHNRRYPGARSAHIQQLTAIDSLRQLSQDYQTPGHHKITKKSTQCTQKYRSNNFSCINITPVLFYVQWNKKIFELKSVPTTDKRKTHYKQCCGAGASRSRGLLAGAGADLKFDLEPEPIFWFGSGSFFWQVNNDTGMI